MTREWIKKDAPWREGAKSRTEEKYTYEGESSPQQVPLPNLQDLQVSINGITKTFRTGPDGKTTIDLVGEFGLARFETPVLIPCHMFSLSVSINDSLTLDTRDWTMPYFLVERTIQRAEISGGKQASIPRVGEEIPLVESDAQKPNPADGKCKVRRAGVTVILPLSAGKIIWAAPGRASQ